MVERDGLALLVLLLSFLGDPAAAEAVTIAFLVYPPLADFVDGLVLELPAAACPDLRPEWCIGRYGDWPLFVCPCCWSSVMVGQVARQTWGAGSRPAWRPRGFRSRVALQLLPPGCPWK